MSYENEIDDYVLIQYIILYALAQVHEAVSYDVLINIITEHININYLEFQLALDNLKCSEFITVNMTDDRAMYTITQKGKEAAKLSEKDIPVYIREPISIAVIPNVSKEQKKRLIRARVRSVEDDMHYADCSIYDDDDTLLFKLSIFTPTRQEAVEITKKFKENPDAVYSKIISAVAD